MNEKILIGSIFVLILLLLMPSIPSIQTKVVKEDIKSDTIREKLDEIRELLEYGKLDKIKHPFLLMAVKLITAFRYMRVYLLLLISCDIEMNPPREWIFEPNNLILYNRAIILALTTYFFKELCQYCSDYFGWNWEVPY